MKRRSTCILALAAALSLAAPTLLQAQPRPLRIILPFPPGGGSDILLRLLTPGMSQHLGQPIIVDNRPGADGIIAADLAAKSAPDGNTVYFGTGTSMVATHVLRKQTVPYDPFKDFTPVANLGRFTLVMVAAPGVPVKGLGEFVEYVRARPGKLAYASSHSTARLAVIQFLAQHKLDMLHVPYKGDAAATIDLLGDRVHMMFLTAAASRGMVKEGKVQALMALRDTRSPALPDTPTSKETGTRISVAPWAGLFGPANMPAAAVERINQALRAAAATKEIRDQMEQLGFEPAISTPADMAAIHRSEYEIFRKAVQEDGISFD